MEAGGEWHVAEMPHARASDMVHPGPDSLDNCSSIQDVGGGHLLAARWRGQIQKHCSRSWRLRQRTRARIVLSGTGANMTLCKCARWGETPSTGFKLVRTRRRGAAASEKAGRWVVFVQWG